MDKAHKFFVLKVLAQIYMSPNIQQWYQMNKQLNHITETVFSLMSV